ncbi:MAG: hypothetical protein IJ043_02270 [Clostridia bacterium]|nr:hypothetical protein [Clostridia bacterium]
MKESLQLNKRAFRSRTPLLLLLSLVVIVGVFWWLKIVGITMAGEAFCGLSEHTHSEACMADGLTCSEGKEEHIHIATCYSNYTADLETASDWEATFAEISLTGEAGQDIAAIAESQLGYRESTLNYMLNEDGSRRGYTRYGEWYGNPYGDWSAMFASFCLHYGGITGDIVPYNSGANAMLTAWQAEGLAAEAAGYSPRIGDLVFLDPAGKGSCTDIGIITAIDSAITVIQGNSNDQVEMLIYELSDPRILCYGSIYSAIERSLTEWEKGKLENVKAEIAALPTEDEVFAEMESFDMDSPEFEAWYQNLSLRATTAYVYYEDLGPRLQILIEDTSKLDALSWLWQAATMSNDTVSSINVFQANKYSNALTTVSYGGSVREVMTSYLDYSYWDAIVIDKNETGLYVSAVYRSVGSKLSLEPATADGFILLVWHGDTDRLNIADVEAGHSVSVNPANFYKTTKASTSPIGTVTFTTGPTSGEDNTEINKDKLTIVESADTSELIDINLYNYGSNINEPYLSNSKYPGFQQDGGTKSVSSLSRFGMNFGNNITVDLATQIGNVTTNNPSAINKTTNGANSPISDAMLSTLQDGYPALADGTSLAYLFSDNIYAEKQNETNINGLFWRDMETGAYHFNSRNNHAQFDPETDTFVLYKQLISSNFLMYPFGNFLPFNDIEAQTTQTTTIDRAWFQKVAANALFRYNNGEGSKYLTLYNSITAYISLMDNKFGAANWDYNEALQVYFDLNGIEFNQTDDYLDLIYSIDYDEATDFFFGMDMHLDFMQPKDGLTGLDGQQEMIFNFIGDDDVWIYVDGQLFLDLSGIHRHVGGTIDFTTGEVFYYDLDVSTGHISETPSMVVTFAEILGSTEGLNEIGAFEDYSHHTLNFYYMERGAGSGVCEMNFNIPMIRKHYVSVTKEFSGDLAPEVLGDPDFYFQVYRENGVDLLFGPGEPYSVLDAHGNEIATEYTDENSIFKLKANQTAIFHHVPADADDFFVREVFPTNISSQYGEVTIDGKSVTRDVYSDIVISSGTFKGAESDLRNTVLGNTDFHFTNSIDTKQYGALELTKEFLDYTADQAAKEVTFNITLDEQPLAAGTAYTLILADGTEIPGTVTEEGKLTFAAGQTVRLENILAGSVVALQEDPSSAAGYTVTYTSEELVLSEADGWAAGAIGAGLTSTIRVTNDKTGVKTNIPVEKTLLYPDGREYEFTFYLREIVSLTDHSFAEGGKYLKTSVTMAEGAAAANLTLNFPEDTPAGDHYYIVAEEGATGKNGIDTDFYILAVTVTEENGTVSPAVTAILKNGTEPADALAFTNRNVRNLTVTKTVERTETNQHFRFDVVASHDGTPLNGRFACDGPNGQTEILFAEGIATFYLQDADSMTVYGLPYGTVWSVKEQKTDGFFTECSSDGAAPQPSNTVEGTLENDATASFVNIGGAEMPSTGSYASQVFIFGGALIVVLSLICGCVLRHKRERRLKKSL